MFCSSPLCSEIPSNATPFPYMDAQAPLLYNTWCDYTTAVHVIQHMVSSSTTAVQDDKGNQLRTKTETGYMCTSGSPEDELDLVKEPPGALEVGTLKCADWIATFETSLCSNPFYSNSSSYGQHKHCKKLLQTNRETSRRTSDRQAEIEAHDPGSKSCKTTNA